MVYFYRKSGIMLEVFTNFHKHSFKENMEVELRFRIVKLFETAIIIRKKISFRFFIKRNTQLTLRRDM